MMSALGLKERAEGCLLGAAIGAELGWSAAVNRRRLEAPELADVLALDLTPEEAPVIPHRTNALKITPFVDLGVRAYLEAQGRVSPEEFGALLCEDAGVAQPAFAWDGVHSVQEVLKEGMSPRLSGLGATPQGLLCAAMPAVGVYHAGDAEYAYVDGVELASVGQGRRGADWAALCAATVAACLAPGTSAGEAVAKVLEIAHRECRELFYEINPYVLAARALREAAEEDFVRWWLEEARPPYNKEGRWYEWNPPLFVLPLLERYGEEPAKLLRLIMAHPRAGGGAPAVVGMAASGALHGEEVFPAEWRGVGEAEAARWRPLVEVLEARLEQEGELVRMTARLAEERVESGESRLWSKVYGCILAGAIGNAMGSPVEGWFWWEVDERYPEGITTVLEPSRLESEDDNQMAMLLVETYLAQEGRPVTARHFGHTWYDRLNRDHFFPHCMGHAYDLIREGWDPRITGHWIQVTGSTVMCMEPVGCYHLGDPEFAETDARAISYMYQRGLDVTAAAILAAATAEAMRPEATVESVCQAAVESAPAEPFRTFDERPFGSPREYLEACLEIASGYDEVLAARRELCEKCLLYHQIDPLELLGLSLAMFRIADGEVRQAAIGGTNIGRDADTIAGRAAMLAGTLRGAEGVPTEWVALFPETVLARIRRRAEAWTELLAGPRLARLQRRQTLRDLKEQRG